MGAHDDVDLPLPNPLQHLFALGGPGGPEVDLRARGSQQADSHRWTPTLVLERFPQADRTLDRTRLLHAGGETRCGDEAGDPQIVLLCEHLGGRHDRALETATHSGEESEDRDESLPGPHLALEEPVHRVG